MGDNSYKPIKDIQIGDEIKSVNEYNPKRISHEFLPYKVTQVFKREAEVYKYSFDDGSSIKITPNHKVMVKRSYQVDETDYVEIGKLNVGDGVVFYEEESETEPWIFPFRAVYITSIEPMGVETVYNLETECHTYIANGMVVHNCYQINKSIHVMPIDVAKRFIDLLLDDNADTAEYIDSKSSKAVVIEFIGGEPLLQIDLMDEIMDYFVKQMIIKDHPWQYHYMISVCSNGLLYFDPKWQAFMKKHWNHLSFNISIDGNKKLHDACRIRPDGSGSYDAAMAGVRHFVDVLGGKMGSKMTLAPANIMYTAEAVKGLIESGYKEINLNCVFEKGWTEEHATILYYQLKELADYLIDNNLDDIYISIFEQSMFHPKSRNDTQNYCGGNGRMISVDWKGDIYPCIRYMESSLGTEAPPLIVGNVYDGITALPEHKECAKCLKAVNRITQSTEECINCVIADGCAYCQALNYQDSGGNINHRATYICVMHQARALGNAYYWNKLFRKNNEPKRMKIWLEDERALKIISQEELDMLKELEWPVGADS